jgi:hypothetical protein
MVPPRLGLASFYGAIARSHPGPYPDPPGSCLRTHEGALGTFEGMRYHGCGLNAGASSHPCERPWPVLQALTGQPDISTRDSTGATDPLPLQGRCSRETALGASLGLFFAWSVNPPRLRERLSFDQFYPMLLMGFPMQLVPRLLWVNPHQVVPGRPLHLVIQEPPGGSIWQ